MKKAAPFILLLVMALAVLIIRQCRNEDRASAGPGQGRSVNTETPAVNRDRGFDRRISFLEYTKHALCRMECRHISAAEVEDIMKKGKINYYKSEIKNARCPRYAVEGTTTDRQRVRIVFAQCNEKTNVVTVIDLDTDWECRCPGDDKKYENKN